MKVHIHHRKARQRKAECHACDDMKVGEGVGVKVGDMQDIVGQIEGGDVIVEIKGPAAPHDSFYVRDHVNQPAAKKGGGKKAGRKRAAAARK